MRRVVVTGLGAITPVGTTARETWDSAVSGRSGIDFIRSFDASAYPVRIAAEVKDFDPSELASPKELRKLDANVLFALGASKEAVADAELGDAGYDVARVGMVYGSGIGGIKTINQQHDVLRERGPNRISPNFLQNVLVDSASGQLAISLGYRGPNYATVSACATGCTRSARPRS
jgi:3-oxoacyl-[acyl-carrier-protein] synthase II